MMNVRHLLICLLATHLVAGALNEAMAQSPADAAPASQADGTSGWFSLHWQATYVEQGDSGFHAPYSGPNSLTPSINAETTDTTLFVGVRLWHGAELWSNPELDQGFGLDDTLGIAGFPSADAYKVGLNEPYFRLPRTFVRQTIDLGGEPETVEDGANQFAALHTSDRLVLTLGKFSVVDVFDCNQYAHDPRGDFLNWSVVDAGTFDYAADAWGYTVGAAAEWYQGSWTFRGGLFDLSNVPNSPQLDQWFHQFQMVAELERRHEIAGQPGKVAVTAFDTRGRMGLLDAAVDLAQETGTPVDIAAVRSYRSRLGASINLEQSLTDQLALFGRAGKAAGNVEAFEFTDIDRTVELGMSMKGSVWHRADDDLGVAAVLNNISGARERYLNAGGLGILVGDGQLPHPGPEKIIETYYKLAVLSWLQLTPDYQFVDNPGYNRDRGPVSVFAVRVHAQL
jgi:high affinity Mn2+ porin